MNNVTKEEYHEFIAKMGHPQPRYMYTGSPSCPSSQTVEHAGVYGKAVKTTMYRYGAVSGEPSYWVFANKLMEINT